MHAGQRARAEAVLGEGEEVPRPHERRVPDVALDRHRRPDCHHDPRPGADQERGGGGQRRSLDPLREIRQRSQRDELDQEVERGDDSDHREQREGDVALRVLVLPRRRRRVLESRVGEQQQERCFPEHGGTGSRDREQRAGVDGGQTDDDQEHERNHLGDREEDSRPGARLHSHDVDPGQERERHGDHERARHPHGGVVPQEPERLCEAVGERRDRRDARQPRHPADLEAHELAERLAGVDVPAARLVEVAGGLREAEDEEGDGPAGQQHAPQARRPEEGRGGRRQQVHSAADDVVDREPHDLPARDRPPEGGLLTDPRLGHSRSRSALRKASSSSSISARVARAGLSARALDSPLESLPRAASFVTAGDAQRR